jgi:sugar/nucleoside kinase (ribokinase family)
MIDILVFGGTLIEQDLNIPRLPRPNQDNVTFKDMIISVGGSGANVAVYGARLGGKIRLIDKWGNDKYGSMIEKHLRSEKVDIRYCKRIDHVQSAYMIILTLPDHDWTGIIRNPDRFYLDEIDLNDAAFSDCHFLHFHGFCIRPGDSIKTVIKAIDIGKKHRIIISLDSSTPTAHDSPKLYQKIFPACDIVFTNIIEGQYITKESDPKSIAENILSYGPKTVIVKNGSDGCYAATKDTFIQIPAYKVDVVDTIGAGDAIVSGTLIGLSNGMSTEESVRLGTATAAIVCQSFGAQSYKFSKQDVLNILGQNSK